MGKKLILIGSILFLIGLIIGFLSSDFFKPKENIDYDLMNEQYYSYKYVINYNEYLEFKNNNDNDYNFERAYTNNSELTEDNFNGPYLLFTTNVDSCSEKINNHYLNYSSKHYEVYLDVSYGCGVCPLNKVTFVYKVNTLDNENEIEVKAYSRTVSKASCDPNVAYKPIIYIYPTTDMDLTIKLGNSNNLTYTYPKYKDIWNVRVSSDGNIYDYDTNRNYYGLYWEAYDNYKLDMSKGFVVKGEDTVKFLEDKLAILGLNEYEINEFIIYWIDKLDNDYNFISFRSMEDINKLMPLSISKEPDTLIRIMVDFKSLDSFIDVEEQELVNIKREGFTIVEWGGTIHK